MKREEVLFEKYAVRVTVILAAGAAVFLFSPTAFANSSSPVLSISVLFILFVFLTSFLIAQALGRWRTIDGAVRMELSRLRRVIHLSKAVSGHAAWKKRLKAAALAYLKNVERRPILRYAESHAKFRAFTNLVYDFKPKTARDRILFDELLDVGRDLAFQRTTIEGRLGSGLPSYTWTVLIIFATITAGLTAVTHQATVISRLYAAGAFSGVLLLLDLLFETDRLTHKDRHHLKEQYRKNIRDVKGL